jgi:hypothetical protein
MTLPKLLSVSRKNSMVDFFTTLFIEDGQILTSMDKYLECGGRDCEDGGPIRYKVDRVFSQSTG